MNLLSRGALLVSLVFSTSVFAEGGLRQPAEQRLPGKISASPREQLIAQVEAIGKQAEEVSGRPVHIRIYFANHRTDKQDAAIVFFSALGVFRGLFFVLEKGQWSVYPSDFTSVQVGSRK